MNKDMRKIAYKINNQDMEQIAFDSLTVNLCAAFCPLVSFSVNLSAISWLSYFTTWPDYYTSLQSWLLTCHLVCL